MADRGNITLSIVDSTLATRFREPTEEADVEQGGEVEVDPLLQHQRDTYFHMDVFRMEQVSRNIITNAVSYDAVLDSSTYVVVRVCSRYHSLAQWRLL